MCQKYRNFLISIPERELCQSCVIVGGHLRADIIVLNQQFKLLVVVGLGDSIAWQETTAHEVY